MSRSTCSFVLAFASLAACGSLFAAPAITNVSLRGLQIEGTTTLVVEGRDLLPNPKLIGAFEIGKQTVKADPKPNRLEIEVQLPATAIPGIYELRLATDKGVSNAIAIGIDRLPQLAFSSEVASLPVALHGTISGTQVLTTKFKGTKGQQLVADVEARRLGARFQPILRIKDGQGRQIGWSPMLSSIAGDSRAAITIPADGEYTVELHDMLFRAAAPGHFRLKLGEISYADVAFPLAVQAGSKTSIHYALSNIAADKPVEVDASSFLAPTVQPAPVAAANFSGSVPRLAVSQHAEVVEATPEGGGRQVLPELPMAVSGRLAKPKEEDQFAFPVKPGQKLKVQVFAHEFGSPLDGVVSVRTEAGAEIANNDDRPGDRDPGLDVQVPADAKQCIVAIRDLLGRGGEQFVYRIQIADALTPDFSVSMDTDRLNIPTGGTQTLTAQITRTNYGGPLQLSFSGLPSSVQVTGDQIPAGGTIGLVSFTATGEPVHGLIKGIAKTTAENVSVQRPIRTAENPIAKTAPWFRDELAVAVTRPLPVQVAWSTPIESPMLLGEKLPLTVNLTRAGKNPRTVRFRLLTTQVMPKKTIKENNRDKEVDDTDRALRLEGEPTAGPDATQATVNVLVPADLPVQEWGLVIAADILGQDGKAVAGTSTTTVLFKKPQAPFSLELAAAESVEAKAGAGDTGKLTGKIRRQAGFSKPLTLRLEGLPKEYESPTVTVAADKDEFEFPIRFAYGAKSVELKDIKLVAQHQPDPKNAQLLVRSEPASVAAIKVVPGEPPPPGQVLAIFEDEEKFVGYLSKGNGQISLDASEKYSGAAAVKVTPDQRYNEMVPNLSIKIREKPGPGEFRFLRFAWKKKGGATICLQLNHDGAWGPGGSGKPGAKFRYHAGPAGECYGASLAVDDKVPAEFVVVTRDLFADFGEFTLTGLAFSPVDGEYAVFDHLHLAQAESDFSQLKPAQ